MEYEDLKYLTWDRLRVQTSAGTYFLSSQDRVCTQSCTSLLAVNCLALSNKTLTVIHVLRPYHLLQHSVMQLATV